MHDNRGAVGIVDGIDGGMEPDKSRQRLIRAERMKTCVQSEHASKRSTR